jgi:hypothetical protein
MSTEVLKRAKAELAERGFCKASFAEFGLLFPSREIDEVLRTATNRLNKKDVDEGKPAYVTEGSPCLTFANVVMASAVKVLFAPNEEKIRRRWKLFAVNYYETGDIFSMHQDNAGDSTTTVILSLSGVRRFTIMDKLPTRSQHMLETGSIVLLDGSENLMHSVSCIEGPSISIVADIPATLE